jgi:outer membrane protein OmpA-like peptidoglycan-associated protein
MNIRKYVPTRSLIALGVAATLIAGCADAPMKPAGAEQVRAKLIALQGDARLANRAPVAVKDAEAAVQRAEVPQKKQDMALGAHLVYIADRKVDTARALAETQTAEAERTALNEQSEKARLDSRTHEADVAKTEALAARAENAEQKALASDARSDANDSQLQAAELQRQLDILKAKPTDRGLVLTLGDTLFATGRSELKSGATANLDRVSAFMNQYPNRTAAIEGFTDSMGSDDYNQDLSQRRADAVKGYLVGQGVGIARLSSAGRGESTPVGDNTSATGRQQNRRVEVVISQAAPGSN